MTSPANIIPNNAKLKDFPLRSKSRQGYHLLHIYSPYYQKSQPEQLDKIITIVKKERKKRHLNQKRNKIFFISG